MNPWTCGKLELKLFIVGASGVNQNIAFGKRKRKNFRNNAWYDFNYFVGNWNTSTYGTYQMEAWIEEDGGQSETTTVSMPSQNGAPSVSYTFPSKDRDAKMGQCVVQFSDPKSTEYPISYAKVKRK